MVIYTNIYRVSQKQMYKGCFAAFKDNCREKNKSEIYLILASDLIDYE